MYIFCSKALTDALNIKKTELHKVSAEIQIDDLYAWHGHITNGNVSEKNGMMIDRVSLSIKNGSLDEEGKTYIHYSVADIMT